MRMTVSDEALARAAADGDLDAYSALLARHYDRIFALSFRLTGRREEAEDLTQDVCEALPGKMGVPHGRAEAETNQGRASCSLGATQTIVLGPSVRVKKPVWHDHDDWL